MPTTATDNGKAVCIVLPMDSGEIVRRPPFGQHPVVGERGSDTQRRILEAALTVFEEVGFNAARVELITKAAGCSRPSFYQYFANKDDVFWKLARRLGYEMVQLCEQLGPVSADATGVATLTRWVDGFLALHADYAPVFAAFQSASRSHEELAKGSKAIDDRMSAALLAAFEASRDVDVEVSVGVTSALFGMVTRCGAMYQRTLGDRTRTRLVTELALIVHRVMCGPIEAVNMAELVAVRLPKQPVAAVTSAAPAPRRGEKTRQVLLEAGAKVLPAHGFHDSRVDDIVAVAGLSHGSFYRYFDSKEALFRTLAETASAEMLERLNAFPSVEEIGRDADSVRHWLVSWFASYRANGGIISTWQELQSADHDMVDLSDEVAKGAVQRLARALRPRPFGDPLVDALAVVATLERMPYSTFTLGFIAESDAIDAMTTVIHRGILGRSDPARRDQRRAHR